MLRVWNFVRRIIPSLAELVNQGCAIFIGESIYAVRFGHTLTEKSTISPSGCWREAVRLAWFASRYVYRLPNWQWSIRLG
jgi:hypothetical protein